MTLPSGSTFCLREVCPKDFYLAQILRQREEGYLPLVLRLLLNPEVLDEVTISEARTVIQWMSTTLFDQNILTVENWLEIAYHLCKQRWDSSVDWLETQPMSKIQTMIQIVKNHAEDQENAMKKNARKKR